MLFKRVHLRSILLAACILVCLGCERKRDAPLTWMTSYEQARAKARGEGKPLMIAFSATWCDPCHELEQEVFNAPQVRARLVRDVILLKLDFDALGAGDAMLLQRFEVSGLPRVAFEASDGHFIRAASFEGKISSQDFLLKLEGL